MEINLSYFKKIITKLYSIDSPTGYTKNIFKLLEEELSLLNIPSSYTKKGNLKIELEGKTNKTIALSAHADTLGLMVRSINNDGTLNITNIGGIQTPTIDGEYCKILTKDDTIYTGTILSSSPSSHVYPDAKSKPRDIDNLIIKIDETTTSKADTINLGINNGDYIFVDPKFLITENGFIKSRFLDDKAGVAILLTVLKYLKENNIIKDNLIIYFIGYEEVGHGASYISSKIDEFLTIDMGCVGLDLSGSIYKTSICCKDSSGPYDYEMTKKLYTLAKNNNISYALDIFPFYSSDVSAALKGGNDIKGALIGPGIENSHGMERTHLKAIEETIKLIILYLTN